MTVSDGASAAEQPATLLEHGVLMLIPDKLYALPGPYKLDGRVSSHPRPARGYSTMNCFLVVEGNQALLLDAGLSVHEDLLIRQLESLLKPETELSVWPTRLGEFNAICNVRPVIERFGIKKLYANLAHAQTWVDFRPEYTPYGTPVGSGALADVETEVVRRGQSVDFASDGSRRLKMIQAPLRLLPAFWVYDEATGTMFTSDSFTHVWRDSEDGPWVVEGEGDDPSTPESLRDFLIHSRYWWLAGADTDRLRAEVDEVFKQHPVRRIAPGYGCIFNSEAVVGRQLRFLDEVLAQLGKEPSIGLETSSWSMREGQSR